MSSSMGRMIPFLLWKIKAMFETTNQITIHYFSLLSITYVTWSFAHDMTAEYGHAANGRAWSANISTIFLAEPIKIHDLEKWLGTWMCIPLSKYFINVYYLNKTPYNPRISHIIWGYSIYNWGCNPFTKLDASCQNPCSVPGSPDETRGFARCVLWFDHLPLVDHCLRETHGIFHICGS